MSSPPKKSVLIVDDESSICNSLANILVVESDASVRQTISWLLTAEGYKVTTARDGFDALLHLQEEIPDLILSDLNMPQMSGFELLSVVRRRFPQISVVATSGAYEAWNLPSGVIADAFYPKGQESSEKLLEIIADLLRSGPIAHTGETAPVWIPRNGKDHRGMPFVVLTCTQCLRSFPFSVIGEPTSEVLRTDCIYCPHKIAYIIDFSRSVNSPEKRAAWKAAFLQNSQVAPDSGSNKNDKSGKAALAGVKKRNGKTPQGQAPPVVTEGV